MKVVDYKDIDWMSDEPIQVVNGSSGVLIEFMRPRSYRAGFKSPSACAAAIFVKINPFMRALRAEQERTSVRLNGVT